MTATRVTVEQVDQALESAKAAVARLGAALFELDADRESRVAEASQLEGRSAAGWAEAGEQLGVMWAWYQALSRTVTEIADQRQSSKCRQADVTELWERLTGASIELPADSLSVARECLPEAVGVGPRASIAVLVPVISAGYERAAETITSLSAVKQMLVPRLDDIDGELGAVEARARSAGVRLPNEAASLRNRVDELRAQAERDPLAVDLDRVSGLVPVLERVRAAIDGAITAVEHLDEMLAELHGELEATESAVDEAKDRASQAAQKVCGAPQPSADVPALEGRLSELRAELEAAATEADRAKAERSARALAPRIAALRAEAARAVAAAGAPLAARQELRGRLGAYRAKAQALGRGEDPVLDRLYRAAHGLLYTAPCDLVEAEHRVEDYQSAVLHAPTGDRLS